MMKTDLSSKPKAQAGFSFVEIIITSAVALILFGSIAFVTSFTRVDITKTANYLLAFEIAQETIDLIQSINYDSTLANKLQLFDGSLVDPQSENSIQIPRSSDSKWSLSSAKYPDQYTKAWFYRRVRLTTVDSDIPNHQYLSKVTVEVFWNEGKKPVRVESAGGTVDRMKSISLSTLIFNETEHY